MLFTLCRQLEYRFFCYWIVDSSKDKKNWNIVPTYIKHFIGPFVASESSESRTMRFAIPKRLYNIAITPLLNSMLCLVLLSLLIKWRAQKQGQYSFVYIVHKTRLLYTVQHPSLLLKRLYVTGTSVFETPQYYSSNISPENARKFVHGILLSCQSKQKLWKFGLHEEELG